MSSISSISGGNGLFNFIQNVSASSPTGTTAATDSTTSTSGTDSGQQVQGHHHHHGHGGGDKSQSLQQIQQAVTSALQSAAPGTDPNQTIEEAIAKVFQNSNSAAGQTSTGAQPNPADPNGSEDSSAPGAAGSNPGGGSSALQAFFQTLQSVGVDPQQFHQDFFTAVQNAQNGNSDPSTAFQSLPPGTLIDTTG